MLYAEWQSIARQNRVDRNEDRTAGANLFHLGGSLNIPIGGNNEIEITLTARIYSIPDITIILVFTGKLKSPNRDVTSRY